MEHRSANLPLILTGVFLLLVALLFSGALPSPITVAAVACSGTYAPPNVAYDDCKKTQTAEAGGGGGSATSAPAQPTITSTSAVTRTVTATLAASPATPTVAATVAPTPTRATAATAAETPTATAALPEGVEALLCVPGGSITLVGEAAPGMALLAFFDERPVGGGFARANGVYSIELQIGNERPGQYLVEVRERASRALIDQLGCEVPGATPTPTLVAP